MNIGCRFVGGIEMICFNGETPMLEKIASPLFTMGMISLITCYVMVMNWLVPVSNGFMK